MPLLAAALLLCAGHTAVAVALTHAQLGGNSSGLAGQLGGNSSGLAGFPKLQQLMASSRRDADAEGAPNANALRAGGADEEDQPQAYTCVSGQAWVVVVDSKHHVPQHLKDHSPICVQELQVKRSAMKFWMFKMQAVKQYIEKNPGISFVIVSDSDVYVNPLSWHEIQKRYQDTVKAKRQKKEPAPGIVMAVEECCWFGTECTMAEAQEWLDTVRENSQQPKQRIFLNSQYMGERTAVLQLLGDALRTDPLDDQRAFSKIIVRSPGLIALDWEENLFMSMSRGMVASTGKEGLEGGPYTCNFGGNRTEECKCCEKPWGSCRMRGSTISVTDDTRKETTWPKQPLVLHLNGAAHFALPYGRDCPGVFEKASRL